MVKNVAYTTKIDKQGRIIIPAELRKKMNLKEESEIELEIYANRLFLSKKVQITPKLLDKWKNSLLSHQILPQSEDNSKDENKWYGDDYSARKIGF